jgi:hypothetical protein
MMARWFWWCWQHARCGVTQARQRCGKVKVGVERKVKDDKRACTRACVMERQWQ